MDEEIQKRIDAGNRARLEMLAAWKTFLESTPPNTAVSISGLATKGRYASGSEYNHYPEIRLQLHCEVDDGVRWFERTTEQAVTLTGTLDYDFITFRCRDCGRYHKTYALVAQRKLKDAIDAKVMKLGEYPPFSAPISSRIQGLLAQGDLELYRKGTRSEAQGLGIGAATYFRRIVDSQWQTLVGEIRAAAQKLGATDLTIYDAALEETQFSTAVEMLKDALPEKLLILDGQNPLTLLYRPLSVQLHALSDEECLQQAADIRLVLTALLENIADVLKDQAQLKAAAARLTRPTK